MKKKSRMAAALLALLFAVSLGLTACSNPAEDGAPVDSGPDTSVSEPDTSVSEPGTSESEPAPEGEPEGNVFEVKYAADWAEAFPYQVESYLKGADVVAVDDKDYSSYGPELVGHYFALDLVSGAEHLGISKTSCFSCKSPDFMTLLNEYGTNAYTLDYEEVKAGMTEAISCYDCHGDQPGEIVLTRPWMEGELVAGLKGISDENLSCAQCHTMYIHNAGTDAVELTYKYGLDADSLLKYFDETDRTSGVDEATGTKMLDMTEHSELTSIQGSKMNDMGVTCADCHMEKKTAEDGTAYTNHIWESPLKSETLIENNCLTCHSNETTESMKAKIVKNQETVAEAVAEASAKVEEYHTALADAVKAGTLDEDTLDQARYLYRAAAYYVCFQGLDGSDGAHNMSFNTECLDKAIACVNEGMSLLG